MATLWNAQYAGVVVRVVPIAAMLIGCGGDLAPTVDSGLVDGGSVVTEPFCDGATPNAACTTPTCRTQLVDECTSDPSIWSCGCKFADGWQLCGSTAEPCPTGTECRTLWLSACMDVGCGDHVALC